MSFISMIRRRWMINRAVRQLSALDAKILRDIGIERCNITETVERMIDAAAPQAQAAVRYANTASHVRHVGAAA